MAMTQFTIDKFCEMCYNENMKLSKQEDIYYDWGFEPSLDDLLENFALANTLCECNENNAIKCSEDIYVKEFNLKKKAFINMFGSNTR